MRVYIAGINGMVGRALAQEARSRSMQVLGGSSRDLDFRDRESTFKELEVLHPEYLIIAAAKVGGIVANDTFPVEFLSENLQIQTNLIDSAFNAGVERVLFLGSSCIYPKFAVSPISEDSLMTGPLEPTNETYAIAKIAGVTLINAYRREYGKHWISAMPTNLYGPFDNFDDKSSHVLPALINRFHLAKESGHNEVTIWGDGSALREFLHVSDLAKACLDLLERYDDSVALNIGSGQEVSIYSLAQIVAGAVGFEGQIVFDKTKPNGTPRKYLDSSRISQLGWQPSIALEVGIRQTYEWYLANQQDLKRVRLA
jgi:GDP-L-fucose synthase